jgi:hypothetical protein
MLKKRARVYTTVESPCTTCERFSLCTIVLANPTGGCPAVRETYMDGHTLSSDSHGLSTELLTSSSEVGSNNSTGTASLEQTPRATCATLRTFPADFCFLPTTQMVAFAMSAHRGEWLCVGARVFRQSVSVRVDRVKWGGVCRLIRVGLVE